PRHRVSGAILALAVVAAVVTYGGWRLGLAEPEGKPLQVRIVQPSIDQGGKWDAAKRDEIFRRHVELSAAAAPVRPDLILWPETAVPFLFSDRPEALAEIDAILADGQSLVAGAVRLEQGPDGARFFNSALVIDDGGRIVAAADKVHVVPFGEYMPLPGLLS